MARVKRPLCQGSSDHCAKGQATLVEEVGADPADGAAGKETAETARDEGQDCQKALCAFVFAEI